MFEGKWHYGAELIGKVERNWDKHTFASKNQA